MTVEKEKLKIEKYNTIIAVVAIVVSTVSAWIGSSYQLSKTQDNWKAQQLALYEIKIIEEKTKQIDQIITLSNEVLSGLHTSSVLLQEYLFKTAYLVAIENKEHDKRLDDSFNRYFKTIIDVKSKRMQLISRLSTLKALFSDDVHMKAGKVVKILEKVGFQHSDQYAIIEFIREEKKKGTLEKVIYDQLMKNYSTTAIGFEWYNQNLVELVNLMRAEIKIPNKAINSDSKKRACGSVQNSVSVLKI